MLFPCPQRISYPGATVLKNFSFTLSHCVWYWQGYTRTAPIFPGPARHANRLPRAHTARVTRAAGETTATRQRSKEARRRSRRSKGARQTQSWPRIFVKSKRRRLSKHANPSGVASLQVLYLLCLYLLVVPSFLTYCCIKKLSLECCCFCTSARALCRSSIFIHMRHVCTSHELTRTTRQKQLLFVWPFSEPGVCSLLALQAKVLCRPPRSPLTNRTHLWLLTKH